MAADAPLANRRFTDDEVAQILEQAGQLTRSELLRDARSDQSARGMSLAELEQLTTRAGIDLPLLHRAVGDLDTEMASTALPHLGPIPSLRLVRTVRGELSVDEHGPIVRQVERTLGRGQFISLPHSLGWRKVRADEMGKLIPIVQIHFTVSPGTTTIVIEQPIVTSAGGMFAVLAACALVACGYVIGVRPAPLTVCLIAGALLTAVYSIGRVAFRSDAQKRNDTLEALVSHLAERVSTTAIDTRRPPVA